MYCVQAGHGCICGRGHYKEDITANIIKNILLDIKGMAEKVDACGVEISESRKQHPGRDV